MTAQQGREQVATWLYANWDGYGSFPGTNGFSGNTLFTVQCTINGGAGQSAEVTLGPATAGAIGPGIAGVLFFVHSGGSELTEWKVRFDPNSGGGALPHGIDPSYPIKWTLVSNSGDPITFTWTDGRALYDGNVYPSGGGTSGNIIGDAPGSAAYNFKIQMYGGNSPDRGWDLHEFVYNGSFGTFTTQGGTRDTLLGNVQVVSGGGGGGASTYDSAQAESDLTNNGVAEAAAVAGVIDAVAGSAGASAAMDSAVSTMTIPTQASQKRGALRAMARQMHAKLSMASFQWTKAQLLQFVTPTAEAQTHMRDTIELVAAGESKSLALDTASCYAPFQDGESATLVDTLTGVTFVMGRSGNDFTLTADGAPVDMTGANAEGQTYRWESGDAQHEVYFTWGSGTVAGGTVGGGSGDPYVHTLL